TRTRAARGSARRPVKGTARTCGLTRTWRRGCVLHPGKPRPRWTRWWSRSSTPHPFCRSSTTDTPECIGSHGDASRRPVESRAFMRDDRIRGPMRVAVLHDHLRFIGGGVRVALSLVSAFVAVIYVSVFDSSLSSLALLVVVCIH